MTWLFVALWKLPASNSLTRTAEARECVYGSGGGPKRPRSKLPLSPRIANGDRICFPLRPRQTVAKEPHRDAFKIGVRMPIRGQYPLARDLNRGLPHSTRRRVPHRPSPQAGIEDVEKA